MRVRVEARLVHSLLFLAAAGCVEAVDHDYPGPGEAEGVAANVEAIDADAAVVIRQVYGGGGNNGAVYTHDFIELFNRSSAPVSLNGWSLQYTSPTGSGLFGSNATQMTELPNVTLEPGQSFLVQEATQAAVGIALPAPDLVDTTPIAMGAGGGKVALVRSTAPLGCNGSSTPCSAAQHAEIIDLSGYGTANFFEGSAATPAPGNATAVHRAGSGCTDTNQNGSDFTVAAPAPRNTTAPLQACDGSDAGPDGGPDAGEPDSGEPDSGGPDGGTGGELRIREIQGAAHLSPHNGAAVISVPGVVTRVRSNGFFMQDPSPDADDATSEALFVFTNTAPAVTAGDSVTVSGTVQEFRPGCTPTCSTTASAYANLTITEIVTPSFSIVSSGNALPAPIRIGPSGRMPPSAVINDDGNVETAGATFDPGADGIDFYESLEGMRVEVANPVVVGPPSDFTNSDSRELPVLAELGAGAGTRTPRGGIVIAANDFNPERVILQSTLSIPVLPAANVGDSFAGGVSGILDYNFGNYKLEVTSVGALTSGGLVKETHSLGAPASQHFSVASFNVENLDPSDPATKFNELAAMIANNVGAPDLLVLEEVQDNDGAANSSVVDATTTLTQLANAVVSAGGPMYQFRAINPVDDQDGGEPGGNIRVAFFYRTDRGLAFVDRPGAGSTTPNSVLNVAGKPQLQWSPGRIDPTNTAFNSSRKPLAGEFTFGGRRLFVIGNHWNSKGGDHPLYGRFQPPSLTTEAQRLAQAGVVKAFVQQITAVDANASVLVVGDLNDFEFSPPLAVMKSAGLQTLIETLPPAERYSYVFGGNSQVLDHIMVSPDLFNARVGFDVVHVNSEFAIRASDHDPAVARFSIAATAVPAFDTSYTAWLAIALAALGFIVLRWRRREPSGSIV